MSESIAKQTATVEVYDGYHDHVPAGEPSWSAELKVHDGDYYGSYPKSPPADADKAYLSERIEYHSGAIDIHVETDDPVWLFVHTNDSYHNPEEWGDPVEYGLVYGPDIEETKPFGCEVWGRVVMWVASRERGDR